MTAPDKPLALRRAEHALAQINALQGERYGNYVSYVRALPAQILQMGLGQALATQLAAAKGCGDDPHRWLFNHVEGWLCGEDPDAPYRGKEPIMEAIVQHDETHYLRAQAEALAYLEWLKKFAVGLLQDEDGGAE